MTVMPTIICRFRGHRWNGPVLVGSADGDECVIICRRCKVTQPYPFALPRHLTDLGRQIAALTFVERPGAD